MSHSQPEIAEAERMRRLIEVAEARSGELHKVATTLLYAYGRCAAYVTDDLVLTREQRAWVDQVLARPEEEP